MRLIDIQLPNKQKMQKFSGHSITAINEIKHRLEKVGP